MSRQGRTSRLRRAAVLMCFLLVLGLTGCGSEEELEITPNIPEPVEEDNNVAVATDDVDDIVPLEGSSFDYSMQSNWLHLPGMDFDEDDGDSDDEDEDSEDGGDSDDGDGGDSDDGDGGDSDDGDGGNVGGRMSGGAEALNGDRPLKDVDTLYFYPTVYADDSEEADSIQKEITEEERERAKNAYERQATAFEQSTNVFAPYYRQTNLAEYMDLDKKEVDAFQMGQQRTDVYAALDYYFTNYNEGRPFFLAGHSQGAMMVKIVLDEYMEVHPEVYDRMIAAYVIGWSITESDLEANEHLLFAEDADDLGVVVSWNTEGKKNGDNFVLLDGAVCINPISWRRENDEVPASENLGTRIYNEETDQFEIRTNQADAKIDEERGSIICKTKAVDYDEVPGDLFGKKSYHSHDFDLYYENIRENVRQRAELYLSNYDIRR